MMSYIIVGFILVTLLFVEFIRRNDLWRVPTTHFTNVQFLTHTALCTVWSLLAIILFIKFVMVPITQPQQGNDTATKPAPTIWHVPLAPD